MRAERRRQLPVNKWCTHRTRRTRCWDLSRLPFGEGAFAAVYGMAPGNEREDRRDQRPARGAAAARGEDCGGARRECQRAEGDDAVGVVWQIARQLCGVANAGRRRLRCSRGRAKRLGPFWASGRARAIWRWERAGVSAKSAFPKLAGFWPGRAVFANGQRRSCVRAGVVAGRSCSVRPGVCLVRDKGMRNGEGRRRNVMGLVGAGTRVGTTSEADLDGGFATETIVAARAGRAVDASEDD